MSKYFNKNTFLEDLKKYLKKNTKHPKTIPYRYNKVKFDLLLKNVNSKKLIINITSNNNIPCLNMSFSSIKNINTDKPKYNTSFIDLITKNKCGYDDENEKTLNISGNYTLSIVNNLNKYLGVKISTLEDDSRIIIDKQNNKNVPLKVIYLYKNNKTWYENRAGYHPPKEAKVAYEKSKNLKLKKIIDYYLNNISTAYKNRYEEDKLMLLKKLIESLKLNYTTSTIRSIMNKAFYEPNTLTENEKYKLYSLIFTDVFYKKMNLKKADDEIKNFIKFKSYYDRGPLKSVWKSKEIK